MITNKAEQQQCNGLRMIIDGSYAAWIRSVFVRVFMFENIGK